PASGRPRGGDGGVRRRVRGGRGRGAVRGAAHDLQSGRAARPRGVADRGRAGGVDHGGPRPQLRRLTGRELSSGLKPVVHTSELSTRSRADLWITADWLWIELWTITYPPGRTRDLSPQGAPRRPQRCPPGPAATTVNAVALSLAISPCPNDTFIFHALVHGLVPEAPPVTVTYADVDVTNTAAERGAFDLVKVSYAALPWLLDHYHLLPCGGALGRGCGPLVLTAGDRRDLAGATVAVPGDRTTA